MYVYIYIFILVHLYSYRITLRMCIPLCMGHTTMNKGSKVRTLNTVGMTLVHVEYYHYSTSMSDDLAKSAMMCGVACGTSGKTYEVETCPCGDRHCVPELANAKNPVESCQDLKV